MATNYILLLKKPKMKVRRALGYIQVASLRSANPSARQNKQNEKSKIKHRRKAKFAAEPLGKSFAIYSSVRAFIFTLFSSLVAFWHLR